MLEKFKDKYTIKSARLQDYDYSQDGMYFVTICTKDRVEYFGEVKNKEMILNEAGKIADQFWQEIQKHFLFVKLDTYQVMPNHVHGILEISKNKNLGVQSQKEFVEARFIATEGCALQDSNVSQNMHVMQDAIKTISQDVFPPQDAFSPQDAINRVSTGNSYKKPGGVTGENNPMLHPDSLANIIRWYKGRCSFEIRRQLSPVTFAWQSRFYDHIIRRDESLQKICEYIINNPRMWERDQNNTENIWM